MNSSRRCSMQKCSRSCRVLCNCCEREFCLEHFQEHQQDLIPFVEQWKDLSEQVNHLSFTDTPIIEQLDQWRLHAHRHIDELHWKKLQEYTDDFQRRKDKQRDELSRLRRLLDEANAAKDNVRSVEKLFQSIEDQLISLRNVRVHFLPFVLSDQSINIEFESSDVLPLRPAICSIPREKNSSFSIASNSHSILLCQSSTLCLVDPQLKLINELAWSSARILDLFFCSALDQFVVITSDEIFTLDASTMTLHSCSSLTSSTSDGQWFCGTCNQQRLFLSKSSSASSIYEYQVTPTMQLIKEWKSPQSCSSDEVIDDLRSNEQHLALILLNEKTNDTRLQLRCATTFAALHNYPINSTGRTFRLRCCALINQQWLIVDGRNARLLHIDGHGHLIGEEKYEGKPRHCLQFDRHRIVISSETHLNVHPLSPAPE